MWQAQVCGSTEELLLGSAGLQSAWRTGHSEPEPGREGDAAFLRERAGSWVRGRRGGDAMGGGGPRAGRLVEGLKFSPGAGGEPCRTGEARECLGDIWSAGW